MCQKDREHTDAELSLENAQYRMANLLRAAYDEGYVEGFVEKYTEGYARRYAEIYTKLDAERGCAVTPSYKHTKHLHNGPINFENWGPLWRPQILKTLTGR